VSISLKLHHSFWRLLPLLAAAQVWGQTDTGQLTGAVTDRAGKTLPGAVVRAISVQSGEARVATVSAAGTYNLSALLPDEYSLAVTGTGFATASATVVISAGSRLRRDFVLAPEGSAKGAIPKAHAYEDTQAQGRNITTTELHHLPNLTRDPYRLAELAGNVSDAGLGTRGVGLAMNGQRESSTAILLDGTSHRDEFAGTPGQALPLDSVREFSVLTSDFTAEYGRASGGIVTVAGERGGEALHGSAYEYNRLSSLASGSFQDNANGLQAPAFRSDQFGGAVGGSIVKHKLFGFENVEITRVRSESTQLAWVPTPELIGRASPNTQGFFQLLGQLRSGAQTGGSVSLGQLTAMLGRNPCTGLLCATLPSTLPLFNHVAYSVPVDSGAGFPQNTWNTYSRADYDLSDKTRLYARYALYHERDQTGALSNSPYASYDLGQNTAGNSFLISTTHEWNSRWLSQFSIGFDRLTLQQQGLTGRGVVPSMYANPIAPVTIGGDAIAFPGYNPFSPGVGGAFGGPENTFQLNGDTSWSRGKHVLRLGGTYFYLRDNRTDAAYQTAVDSLSNSSGLGSALVGFVNGTFAQIQVAVDPQGQFPCGTTPTCMLHLPLSSPVFSRSNRFHDGALYAQDYWRLTRRITLNLGIRWEHFGVQHSGDSKLDSNWYSIISNNASDDLIRYLVFGGLKSARNSPTGALYRSDWKDFAPRIGVSWDVFGNGKTSIRAGYGHGYDRNFGNVTFNVFQNAPNYAVLSVPGQVTTNNFGPLSAASGSISLPPPGARIIDPGLKTAYARFWSASAQREISRGVTYSVEYSGSKGIDLYSVSYPNQKGFRNSKFNDTCTGNGDCRTSPNPYYSEDVGFRGNQGFSTYYGINNRLSVNNFLHSGVALTATYTWSRAIDNISSTLFEAGGRGVQNRYGNGNITINNGNFDAGLLDPFQPDLDRGAAEFDVRHRAVVAGSWDIPRWKYTRLTKAVSRGWSISPLFLARSGQPFSVFDTIAQTLDLNAPRATFTQKVPMGRNTFVTSTTPDAFHIITFFPAQIAHEPNLLTPGSQWPANMSKRDAFRAPGFWNADLAVSKTTRFGERLSVQLRGEVFNVFNHANLYVMGASANVGAGNTVDACFGCTGSSYDRRQLQLAARLIF
jgi:hypothetical protein